MSPDPAWPPSANTAFIVRLYRRSTEGGHSASLVALKKQAARVADLQRQMARINTILAMREQPQRVAEAGMR